MNLQLKQLLAILISIFVAGIVAKPESTSSSVINSTVSEWNFNKTGNLSVGDNLSYSLRTSSSSIRIKRGIPIPPVGPLLFVGLGIIGVSAAFSFLNQNRYNDNDQIRYCWGPPQIKNSNYQSNSCRPTKEGHFCDVRCLPGYQANKDEVKCLARGYTAGEWDVKDIKCEPVPICRNNDNQPVDWFIVYKSPRGTLIPRLPSSYRFLQAGDATWSHFPMGFNLADGTPALKNTLAPLQQEDWVNFAMFSDEPPGDDPAPVRLAHAKGIVATSNRGGYRNGFYLSHTLPQYPSPFPRMDPNDPLSFWSQDNAQIFLCVSFNNDHTLHSVTTHLSGLRPHIYSRNNFNLPPPVDTAQLSYQNLLTSPQTTTFLMISKSARSVTLQADIYQDILHPLYGNLDVATWRRGAGGKLTTNCNGPRPIEDVSNIQFPDQGGHPDLQGTWPMTKDHSKWAVSRAGQTVPVWCIGDMNRYESQRRRYGGAICIHNNILIVNIFRHLISQTECNDRQPI